MDTKGERPRADGQGGKLFRRSRFLDGTILTAFGPGQFADNGGAPYVPPTDWPAAGTLLRIPKVIRFMYNLQEWKGSKPDDGPPSPPDPDDPGTGYSVQMRSNDVWNYSLYSVHDTTAPPGTKDTKVVFAAPIVIGFYDKLGHWNTVDPRTYEDPQTFILGDNKYSRIGGGQQGNWWVFRYLKDGSTIEVVNTIPDPAPDFISPYTDEALEG